MTQQTPTPQLPTPLAVPWTPPAAPAATPVHAAAPVAPQAFAQVQQPAIQPQVQVQAQTQFQAQAPQPFQPQAPQQFQPQQPMAQPPAYQGQPQPYAQNPMPSAPQYAQAPQAQVYQQQSLQAQFRDAQMIAPDHPPMPEAHMDQPIEAPASKSLFKSLLKGKPKAVTPDGAVAKTSGSLFDKNFVFGLAAGLVLGFVVIPMLLGGSSEPAYTPVAEVAPVLDTNTQMTSQEDGENSLDSVLASEAP